MKLCHVKNGSQKTCLHVAKMLAVVLKINQLAFFFYNLCFISKVRDNF